MEAVELNERPSVARRRLSQRYVQGTATENKRRGSLIALEHPSILNNGNTPKHVAEGDEEPSPAPSKKGKRVSILARQASGMSRVLALSSTSESFQEELVRPTIISAMIFLNDPSPDVDSLRQILADRMLDIPRFRCVVRADDKNGIVFEPLARSDVKVEEHIVHVDGEKSFGPDEIKQLINDAYLSDWGVDMPLWRMKIITNTKDGRSLLFIAIDHAIGDGVGLLSVFLSLFDDDDDINNPEEAGSNSNKKMKPKLQKESRKPGGLSYSHRVVAFLKGFRAGIVDVLMPPPSDLPHSLMIPKNKQRNPCPGKDFEQSRAFPLNEIKAMKNKFGGATVNDVIMALLTMAIKRYLETKGDTKALDLVRKGNGTIRSSFPVNMRRGNSMDDKADLGNNFVVGNFPFPLDYEDPVDCVWRAKTIIDEMKASPAFALQKILNDILFASAPDTVLAEKIIDIGVRQTCMISNVMGPSGAASIGGCLIDDLNFTTAFHSSLYIGVLSFGGTLRVSGILDRRCEGDLAELMRCCEEAYDELKAALERVDEEEPLKRPDMAPRSGRILELLAFALTIALPVFVASKFGS